MASSLPKQEPIEGTLLRPRSSCFAVRPLLVVGRLVPRAYADHSQYMEAEVLRLLVEKSLIEDDPGFSKGCVWSNILNHQFNLRDGFSPLPEPIHDEEQAMTLSGYSMARIDLRRDCIDTFLYIVEARRTRGKDLGGLWEQARAQLKVFLQAKRAERPIFGAISVGRHIRFYETSVEEGIMCLEEDSAVLYADLQCRTICERFGVMARRIVAAQDEPFQDSS